MPKPKGIVIISAHWEDAPTTISAPGIQRELVYDFGGFQQRYFDLSYDTPDASSLASDIKLLFTGETLHEDPKRGLDHGAWVPLMLMYPLADVPVIQLSMPTHNPGKLMTLGARLKTLREQGVLIIGSGFITHGLQFLSREFFAGDVQGGPGWSTDFDAWAADALSRGDIDLLSSFTQKAPGMPYAHPTVEHYTPLFITLGAAGTPDAGVEMKIEGFSYGLSKRSFATR
jgi:4,5-DOPA dioxygenase extradiol